MPREGKIGRRWKGRRAMLQLGSGYNTGEPAINLFLAVLALAKQDASKTIPEVISSKCQQREKAFILSGKRMWHAFQDSEFYGKRSIAPLEVAWWVYDYIDRIRHI